MKRGQRTTLILVWYLVDSYCYCIMHNELKLHIYTSVRFESVYPLQVRHNLLRDKRNQPHTFFINA